MPTTSTALIVTKGQERISLQDLGRQQNLSIGVPSSGVADEHGYLRANQLLGNKANAPALEIMLGGIQFTAQVDCFIAIFGIAPEINVNDKAVPHCQALQLKSGDQVSISPLKQGIYCYLAITGGFFSSTWFESVAGQCEHQTSYQVENSQIKTGLTKSDESFATKKNKQLIQASRNFYSQEKLITRFIPNTLYEHLDDAIKNDIQSLTFVIDNQSNKMGYRLNRESEEIAHANRIFDHITQLTGDLSKPVNFGQIQLPSDKQWIVLMKDRQTMGGYPTIGTIMKTDLFRLSQMRPGQQISFIPISVEQAQMQLSMFYQKLNLIKTPLK